MIKIAGIAIFLTILAGCANQPSDFTGKPLDDAISEYGYPIDAVDFEGARQFIFKPGHPADEDKKDYLNPDKRQVLVTSLNSDECLYVMNALYTGAYEEWRVHSVTIGANCKKGDEE